MTVTIPIHTTGEAVLRAVRNQQGIEPGRRLNVGAGQHPMLYWTNLDADTKALADIYTTVPPLPFGDGSLDEIYAGHFLEHLTPERADEFLRECFRCLVPGGRLGIVVPDIREVMTRYLRGDVDQIEYPRGTWRSIADLDTLNALFFYSTVQESPHCWTYDERTLAAAMMAVGFVDLTLIDRYRDDRIALGAWYQFGWNGVKPLGVA